MSLTAERPDPSFGPLVKPTIELDGARWTVVGDGPITPRQG